MPGRRATLGAGRGGGDDRAGAGGLICCRTPVESQVFTPAPNSVNAVPVNLPVKNTVDVIDGEPIETVDYLGVSLRRGAGRKLRGKCRKRTRANAGRKRCDLRLKGGFKHKGAAGSNSFVFTGRLKGRKLKPGRYNLVAKPAGAGAKTARAKFRIVAR